MGFTKELSEVEDVYSTLFHEYQHYIGLSAKLDKGYDLDDRYLEEGKFMSEAFAMAAEHLVCGYKSVRKRVTEFNSSVAKYPGRALFCWDEGGDGYLTNYGYAYVWGQYLRTRYADLTGDLSGEDAGAGIYKAILDRLTTDGKSQIEIAADILYSGRDDLTTSRQRAQELVRDF